jgi:hypothetical protein
LYQSHLQAEAHQEVPYSLKTARVIPVTCANGSTQRAYMERDNAASPTAMTELILITCHFHIKFFYITDLNNRNEIQIKYCPTENMIADYITKPLVGVKFEHFRKLIMNLLSNTAITS